MFLEKKSQVFSLCILIFILAPIMAWAAIEDDRKRIAQITDKISCAETLKSIIDEKIKLADETHLKKARPFLEDFNNSLKGLKKANDYATSAWDVYPKFINAYSLLTSNDCPLNTLYQTKGFVCGQIDKQLNSEFLSALNLAKTALFLREDCDPNYLASPLDYQSEERLNKSHTYFMLNGLLVEALKPILTQLKEPVAQCLGTPWRVLSIRIWKTPAGAEVFGPNSWHTDGFPLKALKLMIYPLGASVEKGTTELKLEKTNQAIEGGPGTWLLFKNSEIVHRGLCPQIGERIIIEVTLTPSLQYDLKPISGGLNGRHPHLPWQLPYSSTHPLYKKGEFFGINIGGGPNWTCANWINLEEVVSKNNLHEFILHPNCHFPTEDLSAKCVYSSHAIEHLNGPTVQRILSESNRVLEQDGNLILKFPDFDKALDCWKTNDLSFFGAAWNLDALTKQWKKRNICDCIDHRAAMIFCSFYNDANGNPFTSKKTSAKEAYFGPPVMSRESLNAVMKDKTPSKIAEELCRWVKSHEIDFHFCHQSAWSREEIKNLLNDFGFEIVTFNSDEIIKTFRSISGIESMKEQSTFCWARKKAVL